MGYKDKLKNIKWLVFLVACIRKIRFDLKNRINLRKTIILNFKFLPFAQAIKFPILVYGKLKIGYSAGTIRVMVPVKSRMIKIGANTDLFSNSKGGALFDLSGTLVFNGYVIFSVDNTINVNEGAILTIGNYVSFGNGVKIRCWREITLGDHCRIAEETQILDTNFHYSRNINTGEIFDCSKKIEIGSFCWVGNRTNIMKGSILPEHTIVASNSLVNKDYCQMASSPIMIGGIPAKLLSQGMVRVYDEDLTNKLMSFFGNNPSEEKFQGEKGFIDEYETARRFYELL